MTFELTEKLIDSIISALENQEQKFVIAASSNSIIEKKDIECDEENFYSLPEWSSADGFALMESFVNKLYAPIARNDLLNVLRSGRGVFRGFKDVLKSYPEVEKKWHYFKNKELIKYVNQWYNSIRETWGLEILDYEVEETDELLRDDFVFTPYNLKSDREDLLKVLNSVAKDYCEAYPEQIKLALSNLWKNKVEEELNYNSFGFVCRSCSKEFIGCAVFSQCLKDAQDTVLLTSYFVNKKFRGLGIGRELLEQSLEELRSRHLKWVLIADTIIPETIAPLLLRTGFKQIGSGYILDLFAM